MSAPHDDELHERYHYPNGHPRKLTMGELMDRCPACREEAEEEEAAELAAIEAEEGTP